MSQEKTRETENLKNGYTIEAYSNLSGMVALMITSIPLPTEALFPPCAVEVDIGTIVVVMISQFLFSPV